MTTAAPSPREQVPGATRPKGTERRAISDETLDRRNRAKARAESLFAFKVSTAALTASYLALIGLFNLFLLFIAPEGQPLGRLVAASALLWVSTWPMFDVVRRKPKQAPLFPIINILYFMYFGLPVFLGSVLVKNRPYESEEVTTAVALTLGGLVLMQIAFFSPLGKLVDGLPHLKMPVKLERIAWYCIVVSMVGVAASSYVLTSAKEIAPSLKAIANVSVRTPLLLLGGMLVLQLRGKLTMAQRVAASLCYLVYLLFSLASGALAQVAWALVPMFFVYVAERGTIPWRAGLICLLLAMPFAHSKHAFRKEVRNTYVGPFDRVALFVEMTLDQATNDGERFVSNASKTSTERTSYLGTLAFVVNQTPRRIPYLEGDTYRVMFWAFVPRIVAPDRPVQYLGQEFGHRYRLLNPLDHETSFNCAQIIEMYMNFGALGVLGGMALVGLYYRALYALFNHGQGGDGMLLLASAALAGLLNIESDAANVLVGAFQAAGFSYVILRVIMLFADYVIIPGTSD